MKSMEGLVGFSKFFLEFFWRRGQNGFTPITRTTWEDMKERLPTTAKCNPIRV